MTDVLVYSFNAVAPIIGLILVGYVSRQIGLLDTHTLKVINRFNFRVCFFAMMFVNLYQMDGFGALSLSLAGTAMAALVLITVLDFFLSRWVTPRPDRRGPLLQCGFRSNYAIIGLVLAEALAGQQGREVATLFQLPSVIYFNIVSVLSLSLYSDRPAQGRWKGIARNLATNPLILGLLAGAGAVLIRSLLPTGPDGSPVFLLTRNLPWVWQLIKYLSQLTTPLALIVLGGQLVFQEAKEMRRELAAGVFMRLVLAPAVGLSVTFLGARMGWYVLDTASLAALVAVFGSPVAVASAVMAGEMGADDKFAGQLVVWTSVLGMVSLFVIVFILRLMGAV